MKRQAEIAKESARAYSRTSAEKVEVSENIHSALTHKKLRMTTDPPKLSSSMRKTGAALVLAPDPITAVPGAALLAASFAMKERDPAGLEDLAREARRVMRELGELH